MFFIPLLLSLSTLLSAQPPKTHEEICQELCDFYESVHFLKIPDFTKFAQKAYEEDYIYAVAPVYDVMNGMCRTLLRKFDCLPCGDNNHQNNTAPIDNGSTSNLTFSNEPHLEVINEEDPTSSYESYEEVIDEENPTSNVITQDSSNCILN